MKPSSGPSHERHFWWPLNKPWQQAAIREYLLVFRGPTKKMNTYAHFCRLLDKWLLLQDVLHERNTKKQKRFPYISYSNFIFQFPSSISFNATKWSVSTAAAASAASGHRSVEEIFVTSRYSILQIDYLVLLSLPRLPACQWFTSLKYFQLVSLTSSDCINLQWSFDTMGHSIVYWSCCCLSDPTSEYFHLL